VAGVTLLLGLSIGVGAWQGVTLLLGVSMGVGVTVGSAWGGGVAGDDIAGGSTENPVLIAHTMCTLNPVLLV
jgi:hypothetical protein